MPNIKNTNANSKSTNANIKNTNANIKNTDANIKNTTHGSTAISSTDRWIRMSRLDSA